MESRRTKWALVVSDIQMSTFNLLSEHDDILVRAILLRIGDIGKVVCTSTYMLLEVSSIGVGEGAHFALD